MKIILIEDEESLNIILSKTLKSFGYEVYSFSRLKDFFNSYKKIMPDLIISDITLPDGNFLEEIENFPDLEYIKKLIITAHTEIEYMKKAFNLGADDFIKKPFEYEELKLRIEKIFKDIKKIEIKKDLHYDLQNKKVIKNNSSISLSKKEAMLLEILLKNRGKIIPTDILIDYIWGEKETSINTLNVLIKRLRNKIGKDVIKTKRELGYFIE